jgi:hypothetical protein
VSAGLELAGKERYGLSRGRFVGPPVEEGTLRPKEVPPYKKCDSGHESEKAASTHS